MIDSSESAGRIAVRTTMCEEITRLLAEFTAADIPPQLVGRALMAFGVIVHANACGATATVEALDQHRAALLPGALQ